MMNPRSLALEVIAVLSGTIIGKLVFDAVSALFFDESFFDLFVSPGRWIVALATVIIFSLIYRKLPTTPAALASILAGTIITWVFFGLAFANNQSTLVLIFMTLLFSAVALLTYRFVHANAAVRQVASDMTGSADSGSLHHRDRAHDKRAHDKDAGAGDVSRSKD
ncbi:hypothetical protein [Fulvimarina sp. MAC3]|uniref:hypothetical protein n=1 Tax=Fulvimarina sp. MAC3 TaxID=3148887 RepID=UPI0031FDB12F